MARTVVALNAQGRVTLPADARRKLGLREGSQLEVQVDESGIRLRPARVVVAEDTWAYTREHLESVRRALEDVRGGRTFELTGARLIARSGGTSGARKRTRR